MTFPWRRLFQSIQEDIEGVGEAVLGDRAERLLDSELRDVDDLLHRTRNDHASAKARRIDLQQTIQQLKGAIREAESEVESLLKRRRTTAARTAAVAVVGLQAASADTLQALATVEQQEAQFSRLQAQLEHRLRRLRHQLDTHRATASLQRAQAAVARRQPGSAPYPEPAPVSAMRMRHPTAASRNEAAASAVQRAPGASRDEADPVDGVIERIARRIKPRSHPNPSSNEQARRR